MQHGQLLGDLVGKGGWVARMGTHLLGVDGASLRLVLVNVFGFLSSTFVDVDHNASARKWVAELVCHSCLLRLSLLGVDAPCTELAVF